MENVSRRQFLHSMSLSPIACSPMRKKISRDLPNFIILFADDLGYGDLSCYGHPTIRTPNLDHMADQGIRMTSFYSASSVCSPARAGLLTGRHPLRCGVPFVYGPEEAAGMPRSEIIIAELLQRSGYATACIGKWHLGHAKRDYLPTARGFDYYFGLHYSNDMIKPWVQTEQPLELYENEEVIEYPVDQETLTKRYTQKAIQFIHEYRDGPFFLYFPYTMPHVPLHATAAFSKKSRAGLYGAVIEEIDWSVGLLLQTLKQLKLEQHTMVIFTSDNGPWTNMPPRMLAGGIERWDSGTAGLLRGSKGTTYEGGIRVPAIFRWPGKIPAGKVSSEPASALDFFPTFIKAASLSMPQQLTLDGIDIMPLLGGEKSNWETRSFFYHLGRNVEAIRIGPWKYRLAAEQNAVAELYHLEQDASERYNVVKQHPVLANDLDQKMRLFANQVNATVRQLHP